MLYVQSFVKSLQGQCSVISHLHTAISQYLNTVCATVLTNSKFLLNIKSTGVARWLTW